MGRDAIHKDDNACAHRARVFNNFLQLQKATNVDWSECLSYLSPTDHLSDVLGLQARANQPPAYDLNNMLQILWQEWQAIPKDTLRTLVRSMR